MTLLDPRHAWIRRLVTFTVLLAIWEAAGRASLLNPMYAPSPSRIGGALVDLFSDGRIWPHLEATFTAALGGFRIELFSGTNAIVMSSPFFSGILPKFDVTIVPDLAVGVGHVSTRTSAGVEPHFCPFL